MYSKRLPMEGDTETNVVSPCSDCDIVAENYQNGQHQKNSLNKDESIEGTFPWLVKFTNIMCSSVASKSYELLERLIHVYTENVSNSLETSYVKVNDAIKLKNHVSNTLTFFHLYWHDIHKEHTNDHNLYLNKMSKLLGIYMDVELKTSSETSDPCKLAARLLNALRIYLYNSEEHIFRVLLRIKFISKRYAKICDPIFTKSFSNVTKNAGCLTDMAYVKFLLALKLWKRMKEDPRDKKKINKVALTILGPHMPPMRDGLLKFIPRPPTGHGNETLWLLHLNLFDLTQAREHYLLLEDETSNATCAAKKCSSDCQANSLCDGDDLQAERTLGGQLAKDQLNNSKNDNLTKCATEEAKLASDSNRVKKGGRFRKGRPMPKIKPGEVILIDLTEDNEPTTFRKKPRKGKRKLEWLKVIMKKYKGQKNVNVTKYANRVEIADAHSTKSSENFVDDVPLQYMPISDNKVSESTESCGLSNADKSMRDAQCSDSKNIDDENEDARSTVQPKLRDFCVSSLKHDETQHNRIFRILKLLKVVGQSIKDPKVILSLMRSREENLSPHSCFVQCNKADTSSDLDIPSKEALPDAEDYFTDATLPKMCQSCAIKSQYVKQELPTSTGCNVTEDSQDYSQNAPSDSSVVNDLSSETQAEEAMKQKLLHSQSECADCCKKIDVKPCVCGNAVDFNVNKPKESTRHTACENVIDKKATSDKNLINMLSDLDKCVDVLNRISEHIMSVHVEKQRMDCLNRRAGMCAVSTTVFGDEITQSSLDYINSLTTDKLNRILELYGKKEFLNMCKTKELYECSVQEPVAAKNDVDHGLERHKHQTTNAVSKTEDSYLQNDDTGQSAQLLTCIYTNRDPSGIGEHEAGAKNLNSSTEPLQKQNEYRALIGNAQVHSTDPYIYEAQDTDRSQSKDTICDSRYQGVSCAAAEDELLNADCVNDFENLDILDSILNGDMNIEDERDITEDTQSSLMSPISHDHVIKREEKSYDAHHSEVLTKPLPEGSLGTTGILNSLLDFDLTNMDSPPNDFMYSNVQAVNPHLIKKTSTREISSTAKSAGILEVLSHKRANLSEANNVMDAVFKKKDEACSNKNVGSSVDIVGFGLNTGDEKTFELTGLEDEETGVLIGNIPSACQSPLLMHSDVMTPDLRETLPKGTFVSPVHELTADTVIEHSYIYQKEDIVKEFQSLSDFVSCSSSEACESKDMHALVAANCLATQSGSNSSSSFSYVPVFPTSFKAPMTVFAGSSLAANDLISSADSLSTIPQCRTNACESVQTQVSIESSHTLNTCEKSPRTECKEKQLQSLKPQTATEASGRGRPSKRKLKCGKTTVDKYDAQLDQPSHDQLCLRHSQQLTFGPLSHHGAQSVVEAPTSSLRVSCRQKSRSKTYSAKDAFKELNSEDSRQANKTSQQKKQILINFHGKAISNVSFTKDSVSGSSLRILKEDAPKDTRNVLYRLRSKSNVSSSQSAKQSCLRHSKRYVAKSNAQLPDTPVTRNRRVTEVSDEIVMKPKTRWSMQCVSTQSSRFLRKQAAMRQASNLSSTAEETPVKKRKVTSKFLPLLEAGRVIYSMNQQETQAKHLISLKKDFTCIDGSKHSIA